MQGQGHSPILFSLFCLLFFPSSLCPSSRKPYMSAPWLSDSVAVSSCGHLPSSKLWLYLYPRILQSSRAADTGPTIPHHTIPDSLFYPVLPWASAAHLSLPSALHSGRTELTKCPMQEACIPYKAPCPCLCSVLCPPQPPQSQSLSSEVHA